jgi:iron(III) transport system ATP-binding protein
MADRIVVMDNGVIDQIGTPVEIYSRPATSFVADFIGVMNFIPGTVESDGAARIGKVTLNCSTGDMAPGTSVTVAIRPEDINAQDIAAGDDNVVDAEIHRIEFLGSFCRAELGGAAFGDEIIHADFSINLIRRKNVQVGSTLLVRFPGQFIQLYPRS